MTSEWDRMVAGEPYDPLDPELVAARQRARLLAGALNTTPDDQVEERARLTATLIPSLGKDCWIESPFYCDYGVNITLGDAVFFNFDCVVLDVAPVTIGSRVLIGPAVQIYTPVHPVSVSGRRARKEWARPISIGDDVWLGGAAVILPGVTIGSGSVIGAGSVVTKSIPEGVVATGNPCEVRREVAE